MPKVEWWGFLPVIALVGVSISVAINSNRTPDPVRAKLLEDSKPKEICGAIGFGLPGELVGETAWAVFAQLEPVDKINDHPHKVVFRKGTEDVADDEAIVIDNINDSRYGTLQPFDKVCVDVADLATQP